MSHFAKVVDGEVVNVIVAEQDYIDTLEDSELWVQTSYNTYGGVHYDPETGEPSEDQSKALRKNYAGTTWLYDGVGFHPKQPYPSWTLNPDTYHWEPPHPRPEVTEAEMVEGKGYLWDEDAYQADNTAGWYLNYQNADA